MPRLVTLLPMAADGVGPSYTCTSLLGGFSAAGLSGPLHVTRARQAVRGLDMRVAIPRRLSPLPYRWLRAPAMRRAERCFLASLRPGDLAYFWPGATLEAFETARARGARILGEGINTRMAAAREVLDAAYAAEGLEPDHGITDARIRDEDAKLALTDFFFAPSPGVEAALRGSPLREGAVISTSYGISPDRVRAPEARREAGQKPVFLFVARGSIRKGLHQLLRAWALAGVDGELRIAGVIEPAIETLCGELLQRPDVRRLGFVRDVAALYAQADVFVLPSLEEGDPLVTLEAATRGLPVIASEMGAGRIGHDTGCVLTIDPQRPESIAEAIWLLGSDPEARLARGASAREAAADYTWDRVAARRADLLRRRLA